MDRSSASLSAVSLKASSESVELRIRECGDGFLLFGLLTVCVVMLGWLIKCLPFRCFA